jgi:diguanylate cyclase (GGDEF)-like protein
MRFRVVGWPAGGMAWVRFRKAASHGQSAWPERDGLRVAGNRSHISAMQANNTLKPVVTDANPASGVGYALSHKMRAEITWLTVSVLLIFLAALVLPTGDWLEHALHYRAYHLDDFIVGVFAASLVLMIFLLRGWRKLRDEAHERALVVTQIEQRAYLNAQLSQMTRLLQSCFALEEASAIIAHFARQLFADQTGVLYVFRSSRNLLEAVAEWGEAEDRASMFAPQQCWALRQGQMYEVPDPEHSVLCLHVKAARPYLCLPLMAHGEVLALLHLSATPGRQRNGPLLEAHHALLPVFTEQIALALSNLKLRDTLRQQAIRDPLTGLFNRRYMEETLTLEIERAKRTKAPFCVMMLDLDHFKRFNDTHGHETGDAVLQALGHFLQRYIRGGDIACRYGGEEFTLILPDISLEQATQRATQLCEGVRTLQVEVKGQALSPLTLSVGIATYPTHGERGERLLQAADVALYQAKQEGRDRAVVAV